DLHAQQFVRLTAAECAFAYRDSVFKQRPERYLIVAVEFNLPLLEHAVAIGKGALGRGQPHELLGMQI
ncbi:hypothetical protein XarbCFBP8147_21545, partial [Xanthomonas arboricola]